MREIREKQLEYDVILVDPHHTYECSLRDLRDAYSLLRTGGALVVHDCYPPNREAACPGPGPSIWCGVTYKAFLDFVIDKSTIEYFTVDTDYGCGVVFKLSPEKRLRRSLERMFRSIELRRFGSQWRAIGDDYDAAFDFFESNSQRLLKLISASEFCQRYAMESLQSVPGYRLRSCEIGTP
jgi:hypothetical protein